MEKPKITTRGLSPLERRIAELALVVKEVGETLPSNLAKKYVNEVYFAATKSSRYYIELSGRKNPIFDDVFSFVKDMPQNTLFTGSDVLKKFRHHASSINSALRRIYSTNFDINLGHIGGYYIKPLDQNVSLNVKYRPDLNKEWFIHLAWGKQIEKCEKVEEQIKLSKELKNRALTILRYESQRFKRKEYGTISKGELRFGKLLAREVVSQVFQNTFQRMQDELIKKGFLYLYDIPILSYYDGPRILLIRGNTKVTYELDLRDNQISRGAHGNDNKINYRLLEESCFYNSGLITPVKIDGKPDNNYKYDPVLLLEARRNQLKEKLDARKK